MNANDISNDSSLAADVLAEFMTSMAEELVAPEDDCSCDAAGGGASTLDADSFAKEVEVLNAIFGEDAVTDVMGQLFKEKLAERTMDFVEQELGLSPVESEAIGEAIEGDMKSSGVNSGSDVGEAAEAVVGDDLDKMIDMILSRWVEEIQDDTQKALSAPQGRNTAGSGTGASGTGSGAEGAVGAEGATGTEGAGTVGESGGTGTEGGPAETGSTDAAGTKDGAAEKGDAMEKTGGAEETGGTGETDGGGGAASGNWLVVLASAMGEASGKHLKKMVELGNEMGSVNSEEDPEALPKLNAEFSAESQIFKMFQEAISTVVKSIGEGMSSVARKS